MQRSHSRGFTLIEILVVLAILAGLLGMVAVQVFKQMSRGREANAEMQLSSLGTMLSQYRTSTGDFPPCDLAALGVKAKNRTNEGNEALVLAFYDKKYDGSLKPEDKELQNTDDDTCDINITTTGNTALREVVDVWGNPIIYIRRDAYERDQEYDFMNTETQEILTVQVKAEKNPDSNSYFNSDSYQLRSVGADGVYDTKDDICPYRP
jgi:prepilin-type N-terminal cleavage/methylation domain-containing protein